MIHIATVSSWDMSNRSAGKTLDDQLEALGRLERRRLLLELATADPDDARIDFGELERHEGELDPLVTMRHLHLPVLEERGFIRWDREEQWVTKGPRFGELEPHLELFRKSESEMPDVTEADR